MGCGASASPPPGRRLDAVAEAKAEEEARVAPLLLRMENIANLRREGLMSDQEYELHRRALVAEIAGSSATPGVSEQKQARLRRAEEHRRRVEQMAARAAQSSPDWLPPDYHSFAASLPPKFTREVAEHDEWRNARSGPMQEYYNSVAGGDIDEILADRSTVLDSHRNPVGTQYDLPRDGTMQEHTLVLCWFCREGSYGRPVDALRTKGFRVVVHNHRTSTIQQMMISLLTADVVWLVSGSGISEGFDHLLDALETFHRRGGGIFIWGDNEPYFAHANRLLERLFPGEGLRLQGNDAGEQIMRAHLDGRLPGHLARSHLIMTGLHSLFEGVTISYLSKLGPLKVLATYSNGQGYVGKPYCAVADGEVYRRCAATYKMGRGRIVIDGGFTKLYDEYWGKTAGTERYVKNATAWLLNMNSRIASEQGQGAGAATQPAPWSSPPERARDSPRNGKRSYRPSAGAAYVATSVH